MTQTERLLYLINKSIFTNTGRVFAGRTYKERYYIIIGNFTGTTENLFMAGRYHKTACGRYCERGESALLGCFVPCHGCIDNVIHSAAGIQLRLECSRMMEKQQSEEPVGPIIYGEFTKSDCGLLADCYRSCLELSAMHRLKSVAFCCISTGEFHFPNQKAA